MKPTSINIFPSDRDTNGIWGAQVSIPTIRAIAFQRNQLRRVPERREDQYQRRNSKADAQTMGDGMPGIGRFAPDGMRETQDLIHRRRPARRGEWASSLNSDPKRRAPHSELPLNFKRRGCCRCQYSRPPAIP